LSFWKTIMSECTLKKSLLSKISWNFFVVLEILNLKVWLQNFYYIQSSTILYLTIRVTWYIWNYSTSFLPLSNHVSQEWMNCSRQSFVLVEIRLSLLSSLFLHLSKDTKRESCINLLIFCHIFYILYYIYYILYYIFSLKHLHITYITYIIIIMYTLSNIIT